jgi:fido (protein-threonine AMPylation protein)
VDDAPFRTGAARAKGGREHYAWWPGLPARFEECLAEATATDVPLPARAARVYLDVGFFHPFHDGNARSAMLALYYVLAREDVVLDHAAPVLRISRVAHDAVGAAELARLIEVLITSMRRRSLRSRPTPP